MATTQDPTIDPSDLPRKIRQHHSSDDPWYEYDGEPLFEDTELARRIVTKIAAAEKVGRYSPRNKFYEKTKIRTKDQDAFKEALTEAYNEEANSGLPFATIDPNAVTINERGPRKTVVRFSPSFGRPAFLGGAKKARQDILLEIKRYETDRFWKHVAQPVFEEYNEKYPY